MDRKLLFTQFEKSSIPKWSCPNCSLGKLSLVEGSFIKRYANNYTPDCPDFYPEEATIIFTMMLGCGNNDCKTHVTCTGYGDLRQEYHQDGSGDHGWFTYYSAKNFEPPLVLVDIPKNTPESVVNELSKSFAVFFKFPSMALSCLRTALETLLNELGTSESQDSGYVSLGHKINGLPDTYQHIVEPVRAIKWLGNDGAHAGSSARKSDVLDGYAIFEEVLHQLYPPVRSDISGIVERINDAKGIG